KARRDAVNTYLDRVDRAERSLLASSGEIDSAFHNFRLSANTATEMRELTFARDRVATALERVRAITPPADAGRLHGDIGELRTLQHAAAAELLHIAVYEPQFRRTIAPLVDAGNALTRDIRAAAKDSTTRVQLSSTEKKGSGVWLAAGCGSCHTLTAAGSTGTKGPDLDVLQLSAAEIAARGRTRGGGMPPFPQRLAPELTQAAPAL